MLKNDFRTEGRAVDDIAAQRTVERARPTTQRGAGLSGDSPGTPEITSWFDGEVNRHPFIPRISDPNGPYFVPAPRRDPEFAGMSEREIMRAKMRDLKRRRMLI